MLNEVLTRLRIFRRRPNPYVDGDPDGRPGRGDRYGEPMIVPAMRSEHALVEEGSYFCTFNPTPGTALAAPVAASFSDTLAFFLIYNTADINDPASLSIQLKHLSQAFTVAPATATGMRYLVRLDQAIRTPTAGSAILVGIGGNPGAYQPGPNIAGSIAKIWSFTGAAQMTIPAVTAAGKVAAQGGIDSIPVVGGERTIVFGGDVASTAQCSRTNPVVIPPGWSAAIHIWFPGNATTGASIEPELAWAER